MNPTLLSNADLDSALDAIWRSMIRLQDALIRAGRGLENPQRHGVGDDELSVQWRTLSSRAAELTLERKRREKLTVLVCENYFRLRYRNLRK
jgi:hypothetical protein